VIDVDSTNGTYVADVQVQSAPLPARCSMRLGNALIDIE
jgi:pSer/pThr/pTyr-binding forkhead associated (FHA) protein